MRKFKKISALVAMVCLSCTLQGCNSSKEIEQDFTQTVVETQNKMNGIYGAVGNREIEYSKKQNLDVLFGVLGEAELSNYYNYKFSELQDEFFCVKITPFDGSNYWYLYYPRLGKVGEVELKDCDTLYDTLINSNEVVVYATGVIPSAFYDKNMGNLAFGYSVDFITE